MTTKPKSDPRALAVTKVAREVLSIELEMEHRDAAHTIGLTDLRRALENAYDLGRRASAS
jgi:hypothetical protein